jgi:3-oxoacyl-[acyl-carrier-protein] synthase II
VLCVLAIQRGCVPPTINLDDPMDEIAGMNLVPHEAQSANITVALNNSFGFGGSNASLILKRYAG